MRQKKFSRRDFLRLSSTAAAAALAAAYGPMRFVSAQSDTEEAIVLSGGKAEVWAWQTVVAGRAADCTSVMVNANDTNIETAVTEGQFSVTVPIAEGENSITAACQEGEAVMSEPLVYTGRLRDVPRSNISISLDGDQIVLDG